MLSLIFFASSYARVCCAWSQSVGDRSGGVVGPNACSFQPTSLAKQVCVHVRGSWRQNGKSSMYVSPFLHWKNNNYKAHTNYTKHTHNLNLALHPKLINHVAFVKSWLEFCHLSFCCLYVVLWHLYVRFFVMWIWFEWWKFAVFLIKHAERYVIKCFLK